MKHLQHLVPFPLFLIFLLALALRTYKLSEFPVGFHADEARVSWNALSILKTGKDDWGNSFPLHYNTFGDFRPMGYFYLTIPSLLVFGTNEFAVRFPGALFGALTAITLFYLVLLTTRHKLTAYFSSLILALSPWHISLSRATSEGIIAVLLALTGLYFLIRHINRPTILFWTLSLSLFLSSYFFYHSARLLVPLLATTSVGYFWWQHRRKNTRGAKVSYLTHLSGEFKFAPRKGALLVCLFLFLGTTAFALNKDARGRFSQVSVFYDLDVKYELDRMPFDEGPGRVFTARLFHNKPSVWTRRFINEYTQYISAKFLLVPGEAKPARYWTTGMGILTYAEFALLILGLVAIARGKATGGILFLFLFLLSPLPAAVTTEDAPNLHRSLFMTPFIATIAGYGLSYAASFKTHGQTLRNLLALGLVLNSVFFLHMYFVHNRVNKPLYRNVGAKELGISLASAAPQYDRVLVTNIPDSPYPWIAFFTQQNPAVFNEDAKRRVEGVWSSGNITFTGVRCPSRDAFKSNVPAEKILAVDAEACEAAANYPADVIIREQIKRPDGTVVYTLWSRD